MLPPETLEMTETSSNREWAEGPTCSFASASRPAAPNNAARLPPPDIATPIRVSLGFMAWLQDVWSGFATGRVYTGDVTQPDSTARTIPIVPQAVNPCGAATVMKNPLWVAIYSSLWE